MRSIVRTIVAGAAAAGLGAAALVGAPGAQAAGSITIWTDAAHAPVITQLLPDGYKGYTLNVVTKELTAIRDELATVPEGSAPDLIWGDQEWSGTLAAAGSIVPVPLTPAAIAAFRPNVLSGFQFGFGRYGVPVQISNLALITNAALVPKAPATFAELSKTALALKAAGKVRVPFAVPQGVDSTGVSMYPLFSGLGGYLFGKNAAGSLDPYNLGLASKAMLRNASRVDTWNSTGLIKSSLTANAARKAFIRGKSPFWMAGPEDLATLKSLTFAYRITTVPPIVAGFKPVPLLRVHGFMVTKFAEVHGVRDVASRLAGRVMTRPASQLALANASGWNPANTTAATQVVEKRIQFIGLAGADGVPFPNIPQAASVWGPYGSAWLTSTSGAEATPAKDAFTAAQEAVKAALG